ncbi:MAG: hypothetical protein IJT94_18770, partial [Oscillibacter sp.]|nr:hypothetical protein [Oscillibacter sp.]
MGTARAYRTGKRAYRTDTDTFAGRRGTETEPWNAPVKRDVKERGMAEYTYDSNPETVFSPAPSEGPDLPS